MTSDTPDALDAATIERCAQAIAADVGAEWPQDANRYRRYARAAIRALPSTQPGRVAEGER